MFHMSRLFSLRTRGYPRRVHHVLWQTRHMCGRAAKPRNPSSSLLYIFSRCCHSLRFMCSANEWGAVDTCGAVLSVYSTKDLLADSCNAKYRTCHSATDDGMNVSNSLSHTAHCTIHEEKEELPIADAGWGMCDRRPLARTEPTLQDIDRSIPQVDCAFMANLIKARRARREEFLQRKQVIQERVNRVTRESTASVQKMSALTRIDGLRSEDRIVGIDSDAESVLNAGMGAFTHAGMHSVVGGKSTTDKMKMDASSTDISMAPALVSTEVLAQMAEEEKDVLYTTRPEYDDGFVLLDCRTVNEITSWGILEGAKVLPAHEFFDAFHANPADFELDYGFAKPRPGQMIICYCQYGPRSLMAAQILSWMGYPKVMHFRDGYYEWGKQYNLLLRRWMEHDRDSGNELRRLAVFRAGLEMQREIASEFNALPMQEAAQYRIDVTRSPGKLQMGEGVRAEAYRQLLKISSGAASASTPLCLESTVNGSGSSCSNAVCGAVESGVAGSSASTPEDAVAGDEARVGRADLLDARVSLELAVLNEAPREPLQHFFTHATGLSMEMHEEEESVQPSIADAIEVSHTATSVCRTRSTRSQK